MDNGGKGGKRTEKETQDEVPGMRELEDRTKRKKNNPRFVIRTLVPITVGTPSEETKDSTLVTHERPRKRDPDI